MKLNPEEVLKLADKYYTQLKQDKMPSTTIPPLTVQSDQVKALCQALCEAINKEKAG